MNSGQWGDGAEHATRVTGQRERVMFINTVGRGHFASFLVLKSPQFLRGQKDTEKGTPREPKQRFRRGCARENC
jgi:hypothetical protein